MSSLCRLGRRLWQCGGAGRYQQMPVLEMKELLDLEMAIMVRRPRSALLPAEPGGQASEDARAATSRTACWPMRRKEGSRWALLC